MKQNFFCVFIELIYCGREFTFTTILTLAFVQVLGCSSCTAKNIFLCQLCKNKLLY